MILKRFSYFDKVPAKKVTVLQFWPQIKPNLLDYKVSNQPRSSKKKALTKRKIQVVLFAIFQALCRGASKKSCWRQMRFKLIHLAHKPNRTCEGKLTIPMSQKTSPLWSIVMMKRCFSFAGTENLVRVDVRMDDKEEKLFEFTEAQGVGSYPAGW